MNQIKNLLTKNVSGFTVLIRSRFLRAVIEEKHGALQTNCEGETINMSYISEFMAFGAIFTQLSKLAICGNLDQKSEIRDATGNIPNFLKTSCEGAKRPRGGGEGGVPPPTVWSFFVFQCGIVCSGAYFRGYFHIFLQTLFLCLIEYWVLIVIL